MPRSYWDGECNKDTNYAHREDGTSGCWTSEGEETKEHCYEGAKYDTRNRRASCMVYAVKKL